VLARVPQPVETPAVATLDDALLERVGRLLVARGRLTQAELDSAVAEQRRTREPLDRILVERGVADRQTVASAVLLAQLGSELEDRLRREHEPVETREPCPEPLPEPLPDVPTQPHRLYVVVCLAVDVAMVALGAALAAVARTDSPVPLPPSAWMALFAAIAVGFYWAWRAGTFRIRLRPWADALLVAGATSLGGLIVLTIRSLDGKSGVAESLLPLWAFVTVYWLAGRMAFYLAWAPWAKEPSSPEVRPERPRGRPEKPEDPVAPRPLEVVPLRPTLHDLLVELTREIEAVVREQRLAEAS
jgi:hypothetical protein